MIKLTPGIEKYVLLQQTELQKVKCRENLNGAYETLMAIEIEDVLDAMALIRGELVPDPFNVLDIGCGAGGIDILVHRIVKDKLKVRPKMHLMDRDGERVVYGYKEAKDTGFYNDLAETRNFLLHNGIPDEDVFTYDVGKGQSVPSGMQFHLIMSLKSCGFHYPVESYLKVFSENLSDGGVLLLDCRNGGNAKILDKMFKRRLIRKDKKHERRAYHR